MSKKATTYIVIIVVTLGALLLLQYNKPKKINWYESYVATHKIPYGTYIFNQVVPELFPEKVRQVTIPPFEFLQNDTDNKGSYFFVNNKISFEKTELQALLEWTAEGNMLFIASKSFETKLLDTLKLDMGSIYGGFEVNQKQEHQLVNPNFSIKDSVLFEKGTYAPYFNEIDTLNTIVLGTVTTSSSEGYTEKINVSKARLQQKLGVDTDVIHQPTEVSL